MKGSEPEAYGHAVDVRVTELMGLAKAGDAGAFEEIVQALRLRAFRVAHSLVGSREDALDLCQEAFLKTYRARSTYRDGEPFLPWFHRILRNTCFSFLRKQNRLRTLALGPGDEDDEGPSWEIADDAPPAGHRLESKERDRAFWSAFGRLRSRDREILALRHFEELSYREIAGALDVPEGTVMSRLFHARRRLRAELEPHLSGALEDFATRAASGDAPTET